MVNMTVDMAIHVLVMGNRYGVQRNVRKHGLMRNIPSKSKGGLKNE
jgi:hypothetical protein